MQALELYHPMGLTEDLADKMQGANFYSKNQRTTFEHYMQVRIGCYCSRNVIAAAHSAQCVSKSVTCSNACAVCIQVVLTSVEPSQKNHEASFDAYEYTVHSHLYNTDDVPTAKFSYDMSPIQIVVTERKKAFYHFVTTTCAIIGGVFTVAGIIDGIVHGAGRLAKKVDLGKQG